jgi:CDP-glucose 4,6-dehydratase
MDLEQIYKGKRVFVTGHTGFKGSWLITWLNSIGAIIKGYSLAAEGELNLYDSIRGDQLCHSIISDIRDRNKLKEELVSFEPDFVFHLAAQPLVRQSYEFPLETFEINVQGTANILDSVRFLNKSCVVVIITTDKVYYNFEIDTYYKEDDRLGGYDPYSASKACAELVVDSYRRSFFNPKYFASHKKSISVARSGNVIGGGDWASDRIIPDIVRAFYQGQAVAIRNPASVRPWQHVLDPLYGYLILGAKQYQRPVDFSECFNFGSYPEDCLTVEELVKKSMESWEGGEYFVLNHDSMLHEAGLLKLDISKAIKELDWRPKMNSNQAINKTISWYKRALVFKADPKVLIQQQIREYTQNI